MEELIDALMELIEARAERNKARADCEGSWGYYGHYQEERLEKAQGRFTKAFKAAVDTAIERT